MIVNIPEDLPISMVSFPPTSIPEWNSEDENFLLMVFDIESSFIHDNGVLPLFQNDDLKLRASIKSIAKAYYFSIMKEWMEINCLPITSGKDASKIVSDS